MYALIFGILAIFYYGCGCVQYSTESFKNDKEEEDFSKERVANALKNLSKIGKTDVGNITWYLTKEILREEAIALCEDAEFEFWEGNTELFTHLTEDTNKFAKMVTDYLTAKGMNWTGMGFHGPYENDKAYFYLYYTTVTFTTARVAIDQKWYALCLDQCK